MPDHLFSITGRGGPRLLSEVMTVLVHRRVEVRSIYAWSEGDEWHANIVARLAEPGADALLQKRLDRIVAVTQTVLVDQDRTHHAERCCCASTASVRRATK